MSNSIVYVDAWCNGSQYAIEVDIFDKIKIEENAFRGMIDISAYCPDTKCEGRAFPGVDQAWYFTPNKDQPNARHMGTVEEKLTEAEGHDEDQVSTDPPR
jgi:hypothetical protein